VRSKLETVLSLSSTVINRRRCRRLILWGHTWFLLAIRSVTLFIAFLVLDERRVQANRRDVCFCFKGTDSDDGPSDDTDNGREIERSEPNAHSWERRLMSLYTDQLLKPWVQSSVLLAFLGYFGFCIYRASLLTQVSTEAIIYVFTFAPLARLLTQNDVSY